MKNIFTIALLCFITFTSKAQTTVNSFNSNDTVWEKVNSPYFITGQIDIPANKSLKIEPGVKVIFKGNYNVNAYGKLTCSGTLNDRIEFKGDSLNPGIYTLWGKIAIYQSVTSFVSGQSIIEFANFRHGSGVLFHSFSTVKLNNCYFHSNIMCFRAIKCVNDSIVNCKFENNDVVFSSSNGSIKIINSIFYNNEIWSNESQNIFELTNSEIVETGIDNLSVSYITNSKLKDLKCNLSFGNCNNSNIQIETFIVLNSTFENQKYPNIFKLKVNKEISNSLVKYYQVGVTTNASTGSQIKIDKNVFISNQIGAELSSLNSNSNSVTCNKFINNQTGLKYSQNQMDIVKNNYFCNVKYDVENTSSTSQNLTQNYFCSDSVENKLYDQLDDNLIGAINYNLYNASLQSVTKVVAKNKSILTQADTTDPIDTACISKRSYLELVLNTKDTICHQISTPYVSVEPTVLSSNYSANQISVTKTYPITGPVNANVQGQYIEEYKATDPSGNFVTKRRYIFVKTNCTSAQTLFIDLNTPDTICHKINTPYNSVTPTVSSTIFPNSQISLVKKASNVNSYVLGVYFEEYEATDAANTKVVKRRYVVVSDTCGNQTSNKSVFTNDFTIYPNPSQKDLNIIATTDKEIKVTLMDAVGKIIYDGVFSGSLLYTIDTEKYLNGAYFIQIKIDNKIYTNKIVISH